MDVTNNKTRKKRSLFWTIPTIDIVDLVKKNSSYCDILRKLNVSVTNSAYRMLKTRIETDNIDDSHIRNTISERRRLNVNKIHKETPPERAFVKNSLCNNASLKKKLIKYKYIEEKCAICGIGPVWNNRYLYLQIDHINGDNKDNRVENLRLLCPNCHTQTESFSGRNKAIKTKNPDDKIKEEYVTLRGDSKFLTRKKIAYYERIKGSTSSQPHKVKRPTKDELEKLLWEMPTVKIAKQFGVSDTAVSKWAKVYGLTKPPRGYWAKLNSKLS